MRHCDVAAGSGPAAPHAPRSPPLRSEPRPPKRGLFPLDCEKGRGCPTPSSYSSESHKQKRSPSGCFGYAENKNMVNHTEKTYIQISMAFSAGLKRWLLGPHRVFLKYKYLHITNVTLCVVLFLVCVHSTYIRIECALYFCWSILLFQNLSPFVPHNVIYSGILVNHTWWWSHEDAPRRVSACRVWWDLALSADL